MHILLLGASPETTRWLHGPEDSYDYIICVDGGLKLAKLWGRKPDFILGDGDSYKEAFPEEINKRSYPSEKDETDSELALAKALEMGATKITLTGFLGGRLDHSLANLALISLIKNVKVQFLEEWGQVFFADKCNEVTGAVGDTVSLLPLFEDVEGVNTQGLKYPLANEILYGHKSRGISNELIAEKAIIKKENGRLLIVQLRKEFEDA